MHVQGWGGWLKASLVAGTTALIGAAFATGPGRMLLKRWAPFQHPPVHCHATAHCCGHSTSEHATHHTRATHRKWRTTLIFNHLISLNALQGGPRPWPGPVPGDAAHGLLEAQAGGSDGGGRQRQGAHRGDRGVRRQARPRWAACYMGLGGIWYDLEDALLDWWRWALPLHWPMPALSSCTHLPLLSPSSLLMQATGPPHACCWRRALHSPRTPTS